MSFEGQSSRCIDGYIVPQIKIILCPFSLTAWIRNFVLVQVSSLFGVKGPPLTYTFHFCLGFSGDTLFLKPVTLQSVLSIFYCGSITDGIPFYLTRPMSTNYYIHSRQYGQDSQVGHDHRRSTSLHSPSDSVCLDCPGQTSEQYPSWLPSPRYFHICCDHMVDLHKL